MARRVVSFVIAGAVAIALTGCSASSGKATTTATTLSRTGTTLRGSATPTAVSPVTTGSPTAGATIDPAAPSSAATLPPVASSATPTATTIAGRVVSKPNDNVHLGDTGDGVKQIQSALVAQGYKVTIDGSFGPKTEQAVKAFQAKQGLTQDGVVGPVTWKKLQSPPTVGSIKSTTTTAKATTTTKKP